MEQYRSPVVVEVSESSRSGHYLLDMSIDVFSVCIRNTMSGIFHNVLQMPLEHPRNLDHREGSHNVKRKIKYYNLEAIIAVGYRLRSPLPHRPQGGDNHIARGNAPGDKAHLDNILTYFRHGITNAFTEGMNSKIQEIKSAARGFRNFENYRIAILFSSTVESLI